jgi:hypothetical protein
VTADTRTGRVVIELLIELDAGLSVEQAGAAITRLLGMADDALEGISVRKAVVLGRTQQDDPGRST